MEKPTIRIYREQKLVHDVEEDCSIVLKTKSSLEKWEIDAIEHIIRTWLDSSDYEILGEPYS